MSPQQIPKKDHTSGIRGRNEITVEPKKFGRPGLGMSRGRPISLFDFFSRLYFCQPCHLLFAVRHELVEAAVGLQYIRDRDRAVGLESVLQERDQHARRCDHGVVQRVRKILLAVLAVHADAGTRLRRRAT